MLAQYGEARVVGSVALDLVVRLDIDVHVLVQAQDILTVVDSVWRRLLEEDGIREPRLSDHRDRGGMKIGVDEYPGPSGNWSIDVWITGSAAATGFGLVDRLSAVMRPEHRQAILAVRRHYHGSGELRDGVGQMICEAVVNSGVRTVEDFARPLDRGEACPPPRPG